MYYYVLCMSYVFIMSYVLELLKHRVIANDLRYLAVRVRVCFLLVSYSFGKSYCGEFGLCKYCT